jgi:hypothetical protein
VLLAACGGPTLPALTDPTQIVEAGLRSLETASSVHVEVAVSGTIAPDLSGTGSAADLTVDGTSASADLDFANDRARATFAAPTFFLSGDVIQIGPTSYVKTNLSGPLYRASQTTPALPGDAADPRALLADIRTLLTAEDVERIKGDDVDCGGKSCSTVQITLSPEQIAAFGARELPGDLPLVVGPTMLVLTLRVEKDTHRLAGVTAVADMDQLGKVTLTATLSTWDERFDISAPPPDQVDTST